MQGNTKCLTPGGCVTFQRGFYRWEKWANRNFMKFSKEEFKILNPEGNSWSLRADSLESSLAEKDLKVLVDT